MQSLQYSTEDPDDFQGLLDLYESLGWNKLKLSKDDLKEMCLQSWFVVYVYEKDKIIATGRIISDGIITGIICGVGVMPDYQKMGIGRTLIKKLLEKCENEGVIAQLICSESLETYYQQFDFKKFAIAMTRNTRL